MGERQARVQFDAIERHEDLIAWSRRYCERAVAVHDVAVDLDRIEWSVSTRARRRAAAVKTPPVADATVGEPFDWAEDDGAGASNDEATAANDGTVVPKDLAESGADGPPVCECSLSWAAFEEFDRGEWRDTLRHELIHVEQFQRFGTTDHGQLFKRRAGELDADVHCRRFADARYLLRCGDCEAVVARRYRKSKLVNNPGRYRSSCCGASLTCAEQ